MQFCVKFGTNYELCNGLKLTQNATRLGLFNHKFQNFPGGMPPDPLACLHADCAFHNSYI